MVETTISRRVLIFSAVAALAASGCLPDHSLTDPQNGENGNDGPRDPQAYLFDEAEVRTYVVDLSDEDWDWLKEDPTRKEYRPGTLTFEGETVEQVALRFKGNYGTLYTCLGAFGNEACPKLSMKLKFSEYDRDQRFYGVKRLNFHSMSRDPSQMRDALSYGLFRGAGVPAPRTAYANLVVNGESLGLFVVVEQIDGRFARVTFPDGGRGNIYKEVWPNHTDASVYRESLRSNRRDDDGNPIQHQADVSRMIRFAEALEAATDETFESVLEQWTDIDALMAYNAVARAVDHWDDIVGWYCVFGSCYNHNFFWYESTEEDRMWLVAWDTDLTFQEPSPIRDLYGMPDWHETDVSCLPIPVMSGSSHPRCDEVNTFPGCESVFPGLTGMPPACDDFIRRMATVTWDRYVAASRALLDGDFRVDRLHERIETLAELLEPHVVADPNGPSLDAWRQGVTDLEASVVAKVSRIQEKIGD